MRVKLHTSRLPAVRWIEHGLWVAGFVAIGYSAFVWTRAEYAQTQGNWALERASIDNPQPKESFRLRTASEGSLMGRIEIPRLDLFAVVFEGTSEDTLARGVGHLTGSAAPGERGNAVLAGHRDSFFRELRDIRKGDNITVRSLDGKFRYRVESTMIVYPDQTEVLQASNEPSLTLITCFPFRYIGNAPQRFVVRARRVGDLKPLPRPQLTQ